MYKFSFEALEPKESLVHTKTEAVQYPVCFVVFANQKVRAKEKAKAQKTTQMFQRHVRKLIAAKRLTDPSIGESQNTKEDKINKKDLQFAENELDFLQKQFVIVCQIQQVNKVCFNIRQIGRFKRLEEFTIRLQDKGIKILSIY